MSNHVRALRIFRIASLLGALLLVSLTPLAADTVRQRAFTPISPRIMGQGGSYVAVARGYESLFTNPAGIALTEGRDVVLPSLTVWTHARPDLMWPTLAAFGGYSTDSETQEQSQEDLILDTLTEQFTSNGFGVGTALGFGYVGNGLGLGVNLAMDSYLYGRTFPLGLTGEINSHVQFIIGFARRFNVGPIDLALGATMRPTMRITSLVDSNAAADLVSQFMGVDTGEEAGDPMESVFALNGWGVGFDLGAMLQYGDFALGAQARDLFNTRMRYSRNSIQEIIDALGQAGLPSPAAEGEPNYLEDSYIVPMELSLGASYHPNLGALGFLVDPRVHLEVKDPFGWADPTGFSPSFWTRLHAGTEVRFLRFFDARMGVNQGYVTMGAGLDLLFLELQFAIFSQEFGVYPGDRPVGGAAFEFAIRY